MNSYPSDIIHPPAFASALFQPARLFIQVVKMLWITLTGAYGLSITVFLLLRLLFGERWWPLGLFVSFAHLLMMPAIVLIVISLLMRKHGLTLLLVAPALAFIGFYGGLFIPRSAQAAADTREITVLTYNLNKSNQSLDQVLHIVRESGADVVAFQELNRVIAAGLQANLSDLYPYHALHPDPQEGFRGQGFISRFPILSDDYAPDIGLGHQRLVLDFRGKHLVIYNTHPMHPLGGRGYEGAPRAGAISQVLQAVGQEQGALLLVGDFNMTDLSGDYRRVTEHLSDTFREAGWGMGFTFPDFKALLNIGFVPPLARIDYVFHSDEFQALQARVWPVSGGSDHRPLLATLALKDSEA